MIYHLATEAGWTAAEEAASDGAGGYAGRPEDRADGFLHFSTAEQIAESARRHKPGARDLVLLTVDETALPEGALRWEVSRGGARFPHVYGVVPLAAVRDARPLPLDADGRHVFPALGPDGPAPGTAD